MDRVFTISKSVADDAGTYAAITSIQTAKRQENKRDMWPRASKTLLGLFKVSPVMAVTVRPIIKVKQFDLQAVNHKNHKLRDS